MASCSECFFCIQNDVEEGFKKEMLSAGENRAVDWTFVRNALQRFGIIDEESQTANTNRAVSETGCEVHSESNVDAAGAFWKIFEFLMTSFETLNLRDPTLAADLLRQAYYFTQKYDFGFEFPEYDVETCLCVRLRSQAGVLTRDEFHKLLKAPYNIPCPVTSKARDRHLQTLIVWTAIKEGKEKVLSGLLRYGVMFHPVPYYDLENWLFWDIGIKYLLYSRRNCKPPSAFRFRRIILGLDIHQPSRRMCIVMMIIELLNLELILRNYRPESEAEPPSKRPRNSAQCTSYRSQSVQFRCLQLAFETIPEPFFSSSDMRKMLRVLYGAKFNEEADLHINELIAEYEELFPESKLPTAPRSLKHLSRCQVRENLRQAGTLPHGVENLGLSTLGKYILLEE